MIFLKNILPLVRLTSKIEGRIKFDLPRAGPQALQIKALHFRQQNTFSNNLRRFV